MYQRLFHLPLSCFSICISAPARPEQRLALAPSPLLAPSVRPPAAYEAPPSAWQCSQLAVALPSPHGVRPAAGQEPPQPMRHVSALPLSLPILTLTPCGTEKRAVPTMRRGGRVGVGPPGLLPFHRSRAVLPRSPACAPPMGAPLVICLQAERHRNQRTPEAPAPPEAVVLRTHDCTGRTACHIIQGRGATPRRLGRACPCRLSLSARRLWSSGVASPRWRSAHVWTALAEPHVCHRPLALGASTRGTSKPGPPPCRPRSSTDPLTHWPHCPRFWRRYLPCPTPRNCAAGPPA